MRSIESKLSEEPRLGVVLRVCLVLMTLGAAFVIPLADPRAEGLVIPGILELDPSGDCTVLSNPSGTYLLDNYGAFTVGDSVVAISSRLENVNCGGHDDYPCLRDNAIESSHGFDFGCGRLYVDDEYLCGFLITDRLGWIRLASYGGFASGDSIEVTGDFKLDCTAIAECVAPLCVDRNTVSACVTPTRMSTWGSIKALFR